MSDIFANNAFNAYRVNTTEASQGEIKKFAKLTVTVFISHKHDDLEELTGLIGFLEKKYDVKTYIDSRDPSMPRVTSRETAIRIKDRINKCDKFILLATSGAVESKWCNWELGFGDAEKYLNDNIAILPIRKQMESEKEYKGNEYMEIYPTIVYKNGTTKYRGSEKYILKGYYVRYKKDNERGYFIKPLRDWLEGMN